MRRLAAIALIAAVAGPAAGCGSDRATRGEGTIKVVATLTPLADIAHNAGGARVIVSALVPRSADPHEWRPGPPNGRNCARRTWCVWTGGAMDSWAAEEGGEHTLGLLPKVDPLGNDPHWWQDPVRVERASKEIRNELARADVNGAGYYEAATADFLARLRKLHRDMRICMSLLAEPAGAPRDAARRLRILQRPLRHGGGRPARTRSKGGKAAVGRRARRAGDTRRLLPRRDGFEHRHDRARADATARSNCRPEP